MTESYVGGELELFAKATNWKSYFASIIRPFIKGRVLEVGAGLGGNIPYLWTSAVTEWTSLEPDPDLAAHIRQANASGTLPRGCQIITGTLADIDAGSQYDTILYIDVLEHIGDDAAELANAAAHLVPRGHLVVLAPAHQFLFSAFDGAIGHYRRYCAKSLSALAPPTCTLQLCRMLDAAGFFASLANALLLRRSAPSPRQIQTWNELLVPVSRVLDRGTGYRFGKTVVMVWRR
jgi:SAM-dependent methyltransferase